MQLPNAQPGARIALKGGSVRDALQALRALQPLRARVESIAAIPAVLHAGPDEEIAGPSDQVSLAHRSIRELHQSAQVLLELIDELLPAEKELSFAFKLPATQTLDELSDIVRELRVIFDSPARRLFGEGVSFHGLDSGSAWIEMLAISNGVLLFTAALVNTSHKLADKQLQNSKAQELYSELGAFSDQLRATAAEGLKKIARQWAEDLLDAHATDELPTHERAEALNATVDAVERLSKLFLRAAEVRLALAAPKEAKETMPSEKQVAQLIDGATKIAGLLGPGNKTNG